jgi:hypothetical protein
MTAIIRNLILSASLACSFNAWAGRPLGSEDAGVADYGTCQIESWTEQAGRDRAFVAGTACGVWHGVELGIDYTRPHPRDEVRGEGGIALKYVPEAWKFETSAGVLKFGVKLSQSFLRPTDRHWRGAETEGLILASLEPREGWTLHANVGAVRDRESHDTAGLLNLALVWQPHQKFLLFAEAQANTRTQTFGGTVKTLGGRYWVIPEVLGIDLTSSRESGSGSTLWTVGFGWYGLSL